MTDEIRNTVPVLFCKTDYMRYISHLDLMRLFHRVLRRTGFKLYLTKGFNPRPVIRLKNALKLGIEAYGQEAEFVLAEYVGRDIFVERMNNLLPEGIRLS
ncbi:MAG: TIGR03936 family radical SAM-associated protein [Candidatus Omnitrophota bacterium]|jgi:radical SAM-linked protein